MGEPFRDEDVALIHKGSSTRDRVALLLGAPIEIIEAGGYEIFHYRRFDSKLGYFLFLSRLNITTDHVYVFFNREGVVEEIIYGKRTPGLQFQVWPFGE
jgi:outer membrane protein assembly factor BamE (lipoprotein component of BamABCDE complex)